jgi:hypothetical protein
VQRHVVKDRVDTSGIQRVQDGGPVEAGGEQHVIHVGVVHALGWHMRPCDGETGDFRVIGVPDPPPTGRDLVGRLELRPQKRGGDLAR